MPKRSSKKRTQEPQQIAKRVLDTIVTDAEPAKVIPPEKNPAAVALGKLGGLKGGVARAKTLSANKRSEIAKKAALTRWAKKEK